MSHKSSKMSLHNGPKAPQELNKITALVPRLDKNAFDPGALIQREHRDPGT